ncbi:hypothetical protein HGM15179_019893, partial [Zosterops borbonicus]
IYPETTSLVCPRSLLPSGLSDLILLGNPFKCSCEIMWIKKFQETKYYRETLDLYCIDDTTKRISLLDMKVLNC